MYVNTSSSSSSSVLKLLRFLSPPPSFTTEPPSASFSSEGSDWSDDTRTQQWNSATSLSIRIREIPSPWFVYELRVLRGWLLSDLIRSELPQVLSSWESISHSLRSGEAPGRRRGGYVPTVSQRAREDDFSRNARASGWREGRGGWIGRKKKLREEIEAVIRKDESELMNENTQTDEGGGGEELIQSRDSPAETPGDALWRR